MLQSLAFKAFLWGLISACSLPLGAITSTFWRPAGRIVAFLMAFGGGALLAALTIDLVGSALEKGHVWWLTLGCVLGGVSFVVLNQVVNYHGGFLRKVSTTVFYLHRQERRRFHKMRHRIRRLEVFRELSRSECGLLADSVICRDFAKGSTIFRQKDPSSHVFIVEHGTVELLDPLDNFRPIQQMVKGDAFGHMAFLTASPHAFVAVAAEETRVLMLPRYAFERLLGSSPRLVEAVQEFLRSERTLDYLIDRQDLSREHAEQWIERALENLQAGSWVEPAVEADQADEDFRRIASQIRRVPIFHQLQASDVERLASRLFFKKHAPGHTFFHQGEPAERMYIVERGIVTLIDPQDRGRRPVTVRNHEAFGAMSFLTGLRHAATAVAVTEAKVWVLRKQDFDELLKESPGLAQAVEQFLQEELFTAYLEKKQDLDEDTATRWVRKAVKSVDAGYAIPRAASMTNAVHEQKGAPLAIWLGILLDGIPESLVIGSSMLHAHVSLSLIAGLFLSNYPEALSSSVGMRQQGMSFARILLMWSSLMAITGVGAAVGSIFFVGAPPVIFSVVEGVAAGAMLTMIAETMLPEAYFKGGSIVGFSTLLGFLAAILFKTFETGGA
jgi:CRP-like cAMP-binding protein